MDAVYLTLFVSAVLGALGVGLFLWTHRQRTREHNDRLALLPLDDDASSILRPFTRTSDHE